MGTTTEIIFFPRGALRAQAAHHTASPAIGGILSGLAKVIVVYWWHHFGDNDLLGWTITVAYLLVAALCFRTARAVRRHDRSPGKRGELVPSDTGPLRSRPADWVVIGAGMLLLGLNKQLDLQILARDTGLAFVRILGFDAQRRWVGRLFFLALSAVILLVLARSARHLRRARRGHGLTLAGLAMLAFFLIVRAAGYQPYLRDLNLRFKDVLHLVFELGGLVLIGLSAWNASHFFPSPSAVKGRGEGET
jgi:hypothetical protein